MAGIIMKSTDSRFELSKIFAKINQFLSWPIVFLYFNIFFKLKIKNAENLQKISSPFIIISNHVSTYDSFIFRLVLGIRGKNLPLRFMAVNKFDYWYLNLLSKLFIIDLIYLLFGVFIVVKGRGINKNLEEAIRIINNNGNVVIYPEGSIIKTEGISDFKRGAAMLAKQTRVPVIPVMMNVSKGGFRREFKVNVDEIIKVDYDLSVEEINKVFYERMVELRRGS